MYIINVNNFDIQKICYSGQCFRMKELEENTYEIIAYDTYVKVSQQGKELTFTCSEEEYESIWKEYFDLQEDYDSIMGLVPMEDSYMKKAIQKGYGIRILKQDLWEIIISFLISQQNNIPRIKKSIQMLCERYGEKKMNAQKEIYHTFPKPEAFIDVSEEELKVCNLGYRDKYILRTAREVVEGKISLEAIKRLSYEEAKKELLKLYGVGVKVSECICLYGLHHLEAFPIDTHIQNVLKENYPEGFPFDIYGKYSGVLQQYAFYYDLHQIEVNKKGIEGIR